MRIIGGNFKGKKILPPRDGKTRPLRDLVKESIFNLLIHSNKLNFHIQNSSIIDLFSGSGSFGIECISRGAKNVTFVENYNGVLEILKKNIINLSTNNKIKIIEKNCFNYLDSSDLIENEYDLVFLDPPYKEKKISLLIRNIKKRKILKQNGVIILHRHKNDNVEIKDNLNILDERHYGISKIIFGN